MAKRYTMVDAMRVVSVRGTERYGWAMGNGDYVTRTGTLRSLERGEELVPGATWVSNAEAERVRSIVSGERSAVRDLRSPKDKATPKAVKAPKATPKATPKAVKATPKATPKATKATKANGNAWVDFVKECDGVENANILKAEYPAFKEAWMKRRNAAAAKAAKATPKAVKAEPKQAPQMVDMDAIVLQATTAAVEAVAQMMPTMIATVLAGMR